MKKLILCLLLSSTSIFACDKVADCINEASKLTGTQYIYDAGDVKGEIKSTSGLSWTKENADALLSEALSIAGYTRVPVVQANTYKIINQRDIRYNSSFRSLRVDKKGGNEIPMLSDYMELHYKTENGNARAQIIARNLRPFCSRYGRVIDAPGGLLIILDTGHNLARMLEIIRSSDIPVTKEELAEMKKREERHEERKGKGPYFGHGKKSGMPQEPKSDKPEEKPGNKEDN